MILTEKTLQFTSCQSKAIDYTDKWARSEDLFVTICGSAGTGKTFLGKYVADRLPFSRVVIATPTHKALKVAKKSMQIDGKTIQSILGIMADTQLDDFDPANVVFDKKNPPSVDAYDVILLDEASMLNKAFLDYLMEECERYNTRVIFIGDPIQIPPVGETRSEAFNPAIITGGIVYLSTPVRQSVANPAYILLLADRNDIEQSQQSYDVLTNHLTEQGLFSIELGVALMKTPFNAYQVVRKHLSNEMFNEIGEGFKLYSDPLAFHKAMNHSFHNYLTAEDYNGVRMLCYQNDTVGKYNASIRANLFPGVYDDIIEGDLLMAYRGITGYDPKTKKTFNIVNNSEELIVRKVMTHMMNTKLTVFSASLESIDMEGTREINLNFLQKKDSLGYIKAYWEQIAKATKRGWQGFYQFYDSHLLLEDLKKKHQNTKLPSKAFDYAYALTVHKSQGSTFNEVFIDITDITQHYYINKFFAERDGTWNEETDQVYQRITKQLRYVAASRAKKVTHFLI